MYIHVCKSIERKSNSDSYSFTYVFSTSQVVQIVSKYTLHNSSSTYCNASRASVSLYPTVLLLTRNGTTVCVNGMGIGYNQLQEPEFGMDVSMLLQLTIFPTIIVVVHEQKNIVGDSSQNAYQNI